MEASADAGPGFGITGGDQPFGGGSGRGPLDEILALASGTLTMGLVAVLALAAGVIVIARSRRRTRWPDDEEDTTTTPPPAPGPAAEAAPYTGQSGQRPPDLLSAT